MSASVALKLIILRHRPAFVAITQKGRKYAAPGVIVLTRETPPHDQAPLTVRYGLTASGKIGNAVTRNRARRRLRALAFEILTIHGRPSSDYVLIARAATPKRPFEALRQDLIKALKKLDAWRG